MRINAARDIETRAWPSYEPPRVQFRIGVVRVTATPTEARAFAAQLTEAARQAEQPRPPVDPCRPVSVPGCHRAAGSVCGGGHG